MGEGRVPDWKVAWYRTGEMPPKMASEVESKPSLADRVEELGRQEADLLLRRPPRVLAAEVDRRLRAGTPRGRRWMWGLAVAACVAVAAPLALRTDPGGPTDVREKGSATSLRLYREVPGGVEELHPLDAVPAGSRIQLTCGAPSGSWGAVLSLDGRGAVTQHLPPSGSQAVPLDGPMALPQSFTLDDSPSFERFFLVTAEKSFDLEPVRGALQALASRPDAAPTAAPGLERGLSVTDFLLRKVGSP